VKVYISAFNKVFDNIFLDPGDLRAQIRREENRFRAADRTVFDFALPEPVYFPGFFRFDRYFDFFFGARKKLAQFFPLRHLFELL
jgi:hypothetical protein